MMSNKTFRNEFINSSDVNSVFPKFIIFIIKWGTILSGLIILLIIFLIGQIKYPQYCNAMLKVRGHSYNTIIKANYEQQVKKILIKSGSFVQEGDTIALIDSNKIINTILAPESGDLYFARGLKVGNKLSKGENIYSIFTNYDSCVGVLFLETKPLHNFRNGQSVFLASNGLEKIGEIIKTNYSERLLKDSFLIVKLSKKTLESVNVVDSIFPVIIEMPSSTLRDKLKDLSRDLFSSRKN